MDTPDFEPKIPFSKDDYAAISVAGGMGIHLGPIAVAFGQVEIGIILICTFVALGLFNPVFRFLLKRTIWFRIHYYLIFPAAVVLASLMASMLSYSEYRFILFGVLFFESFVIYGLWDNEGDVIFKEAKE